MRFDKFKRIIAVLLAVSVLSLALYGCSKSTSSGNDSTSTAVSDDDMFTDRDYDSSYDESTAVKITLADGNISCSSSNVSIDGDAATITAEGTYIISGSLSNGKIVVDADDSAKIQLVLNGVQINCETSAALYVKNADKVFVTLAQGSENTLSNSADFVAIDDNNIDSVIFSKSDLTFNGAGTLTVNAAYGHGIVSKDDLVFTAGTYNITTADHGLQGKDSIRIADGTFNIKCTEDGLHSENKDDSSKGFVYIIGGTLNIAAGDDGIHSGTSLTVKGGEINVTESYEGLEGQTIDISGGTISVVSSDDGFNAASSNSSSSDQADPMASDDSCNINISGGKITIDADGDGIDSNGNITISGGEVYVAGPESGGDGALDYNGTGTITGGTVIMLGSSQMAQNFGSDSTQGVMLVTFNETTGETSLANSGGTVLVSFSSSKKYASAVISTPDVKKGETYTVTAGGESQTVEMTDTVYGSDAQPGGNGMGQTPPDMQNGDNSQGSNAPGNSPGGNSSGGQPPEKPSGSDLRATHGNSSSQSAASESA